MIARARASQTETARRVVAVGTRHVRGLVARNRHGLLRLRRAVGHAGTPTVWIASINMRAVGEYLTREIAMRQVEERIVSDMKLVLHDWELYRAAKAKRHG